MAIIWGFDGGWRVYFQTHSRDVGWRPQFLAIWVSPYWCSCNGNWLSPEHRCTKMKVATWWHFKTGSDIQSLMLYYTGCTDLSWCNIEENYTVCKCWEAGNIEGHLGGWLLYYYLAGAKSHRSLLITFLVESQWGEFRHEPASVISGMSYLLSS